jgi:hypothetical protein
LSAHNSKETGEIFRISPRKSARGIRPLTGRIRDPKKAGLIFDPSDFKFDITPPRNPEAEETQQSKYRIYRDVARKKPPSQLPINGRVG